MTDEQSRALELEIHAWDLRPANGSQKYWDTHYQPLKLNGDDGPPIYRPVLSDLGEEAIDQWSDTLSFVRDPFLKARYADLLWDLAHVIGCGRPRDFRAGQIAVDAYAANSVPPDSNSDIYAVLSFERAFEIAKEMNDTVRIDRVLDGLFSLGEQAPLSSMGVWCVVSRCLLGLRKRTSNREAQLATYLEKRLQQTNDEVNGHASDAALKSLLELYKGEPRREDRLRVIKLHMATWEAQAKASSAGVAISWLSNVVATLEKEGVYEDAERLRVVIEELGPKALDEMHTFHAETTMDRKEVEDSIETLIAVDHPFLALFRLARNLAPNCDTLRAQAIEHDKTFMYRRLFHRVIIGHDGLPKATIGSAEDDMPGVMVEEAMHSMLLAPSLFHLGYTTAKGRFQFQPDALMSTIGVSFFCSEEIAGPLREGLEAYDASDYTKAISVLIPQIEAMLREVLKFLGIPIHKSRRQGGMSERKNMNDILSDQRVEELLEEDFLFFLRIVFIDKRGWNLRNEFAHGALPTKAYKVNTASAVMMALIQFGMIGPHGVYLSSEVEQHESSSPGVGTREENTEQN